MLENENGYAVIFYHTIQRATEPWFSYLLLLKLFLRFITWNLTQ